MGTFFSLFIPLFILMDFIGTIPVFIGLTQDYPFRERIRIAVLASVVAGGIVVAFALFGKGLMHYFAVSIEAVKVGGGLLLLYIAFMMIMGGQSLADDKGGQQSIIISPLAIPMLAGPGCMTFAMVKYLELPPEGRFMLFVAIGSSVVAGAGLLSVSSVILKAFGKAFTRGLEKLTAVVVSFIALEMIMGGLKMYFQS